jgi:endogenous inhibitor of DNA gyrase (YacG/DUF329 family)
MRCQESGQLAPPRRRVITIDQRHRELRTCGSCGRAVPVVVRREETGWTERLDRHGNREPCPLCGSQSPRHHPSDHEETA